MFICLDCGRKFFRPKVSFESHADNYTYLENFFSCPYCFGSFEKGQACRICGAWFLEDQLLGGVCASCGQEMEAAFKALIQANFSPEELNYLGLLSLL